MTRKRMFYVFAAAMISAAMGPISIWQSPGSKDDLTSEIQIGLARMLENISVPGTAHGVVLASPSQHDPNYYYHWTRDAGLTIGVLLDELPRYSQVGPSISQWATFERGLQAHLVAQGGNLGEPKFEVNGDVFTGPWGRPQNDGPAIRSMGFMRAYGRPDQVIETDLDYLKGHWTDQNFDLWEEVKGHHFFTRYAQMAAFYRAARLYANVDPNRARSYSFEAQRIEDSLGAFVDPNRQLVVPTLPGSQGIQKNAGLDISTVLAPMYFGAGLRWSASASYVMSTALRLEETFRRLYPVNSQYPDMAPGVGRYPEDVYDGSGFSQGHPWFLATFGMGEYYCSLVKEIGLRGSFHVDRVNVNFFRAVAPQTTMIAQSTLTFQSPEFKVILQGLQSKGRSFLQRAMFHGGSDRHYSEQFDRNSGYRRGARDLTWSYASSVRAFRSCSESAAVLNQIFISK